MNTHDIEQIWKTGVTKIPSEPEGAREAINRSTRRALNKSRIITQVYLWVYLGMLALTLVFGCMNLAGYRENPSMMAIQAGLVLISAAGLAYGLFLFRRFRLMDRDHNDLLTAIRKKIRFYRFHYEIWIAVLALTVFLAPFAINTFVDNENGTYRINNPVAYALVHSFLVLFTWILVKLVHLPLVGELRAHLTDLERQSNEATGRFYRSRNKWIGWAIAGLILVAVAIALVLAISLVISAKPS